MTANTALHNEVFAGRHQQASAAFRSAAPDGIAAIDRIGTVVTLKRDDALFREGDLADYYFKVVSGAVRGCKLLADGRRHIGDFYLPGDFIGLDAAETYAFSAEAVSDVTIIRYARRKVEALAWQEPQVAKSLIKMMREGLCAARERMTLLGHLTAMERIASFLLTMADRTNDEQVSIPMTRTDIGDYLGLTMETVSRAFSQLKSEGVIKQKSMHEVVIADRDALEDLAEVA
jgi:CRP/FNR family transcriptional regulator, anaerobic regulatory protein